MAARKAVVRTSNGLVENIIEIESDSDYTAPSGCTLVPATDDARIGGTWTGSAFTPPPVPGADPLGAQYTRCRDYVISAAAGDTADRLDAYLSTASPTAAETVAAVKETVRTLRALIRIVRGMS